MRKLIIFNVVLIVMSSCAKKENKQKCIYKELNTVFLTEYLIVKDTCEVFNDYPYVEYYNDDKIIMSGFSDRFTKEGEWSFFNKNEKEEVSGLFRESQPQGIWNFKNLGNLNWEVFRNPDKGFFVSLPIEWEFFRTQDGASYGVCDRDSENLKDYNLKMIFTSIKLDQIEGSVKELYEKTIQDFEKQGFENVFYKKLDIEDLEEAYEICYEEKEMNSLNTELFYVGKNRLFIMSSSIKKKSLYDFSIVKEIMETSFKGY